MYVLVCFKEIPDLCKRWRPNEAPYKEDPCYPPYLELLVCKASYPTVGLKLDTYESRCTLHATLKHEAGEGVQFFSWKGCNIQTTLNKTPQVN